jgi:hypothetical protein
MFTKKFSHHLADLLLVSDFVVLPGVVVDWLPDLD